MEIEQSEANRTVSVESYPEINVLLILFSKILNGIIHTISL